MCQISFLPEALHRLSLIIQLPESLDSLFVCRQFRGLGSQGYLWRSDFSVVRVVGSSDCVVSLRGTGGCASGLGDGGGGEKERK